MLLSPLSRDTISRWFSRALFNTEHAHDYFEPLLDRFNPYWSLQSIKALVEKTKVETADTITLTLRPNSHFDGFKAGQHVQLGFEINGRHRHRFFSIASTPVQWQEQGTFDVTIKAQNQGEVTPWIAKHLKKGDVIGLEQAQGDFILPPQSDFTLYVAGGSGITPIMSHLRSLAQQEFPYPVALLYYAPNDSAFIFRDELAELARCHDQLNVFLIATGNEVFRSEHASQLTEESQHSLTGHICTTHLQQITDSVNGTPLHPSHIFVCGPTALKKAVFNLCSSYFSNTAQMHEEDFGLTEQCKTLDDSTPHSVQLSNSGRSFACDSQSSLLEAAEKSGFNPTHGCRIGICHTCQCKKTTGVVRNLKTGALSSAGEEFIQLCISTPLTPLTLEL